MRDLIIERAGAMGLTLPPDAAEKLAAYHDMLIRANAVMNLTRVPDDPDEAIDRNYLDALTPLSAGALPEGLRTLCDVGSGAGLPGIPLAIALPDVRVTMIDSLGKRVRFIEGVIAELGLNAECLHARAEDAGRDPRLRDAFDVVTARAVAALPTLIELCAPLIRPGGRMIAYKGPSLQEELARSDRAIKALNCCDPAALDAPIPGRDWAHTLFILRKKGPTPRAYPRKAGEAARSPL